MAVYNSKNLITYIISITEYAKEVDKLEQLNQLSLREITSILNCNVKCNWSGKVIGQERLVGLLFKIALEDLSEASGFLMIIYAHGNEAGVVMENYEIINYEWIVTIVSRNESLKKLPKWFVFACCHGRKLQEMLFPSANPARSLEFEVSQRETVISHAAPFGFAASKDIEGKYGALYLNHLAALLKRLMPKKETEDASKVTKEVNLYRLLTMLNSTMANCTEYGRSHCPEFISRLCDDYVVRLHPLPFEISSTSTTQEEDQVLDPNVQNLLRDYTKLQTELTEQLNSNPLMSPSDQFSICEELKFLQQACKIYRELFVAQLNTKDARPKNDEHNSTIQRTSSLDNLASPPNSCDPTTLSVHSLKI